MATRDVSDGTRTFERWTNEGTTPGYYSGDPLTKQRDLTAAEAADLAAVDSGTARLTNKAGLEDRAAQALAGNQTFLNLASPTNAQTLAQVKALTKQVNALIRLRRDDLLDDTTGT
jgi:hypothetical protein